MMRAKQAPIRASEIGNYLYCQRSWWYQAQGLASENVEELSRGSRAHDQHGNRFRRARQIRVAGWLLLTLAMLIFALQLLL
jgi:hypothetical protein